MTSFLYIYFCALLCFALICFCVSVSDFLLSLGFVLSVLYLLFGFGFGFGVAWAWLGSWTLVGLLDCWNLTAWFRGGGGVACTLLRGASWIPAWISGEVSCRMQ